MHHTFTMAVTSKIVDQLPIGKDGEPVEPVTTKEEEWKYNILKPSKTENIEDSVYECEDDRKRQEHARADFTQLVQKAA